MFLQR
jgi:hypothetical protein